MVEIIIKKIVVSKTKNFNKVKPIGGKLNV